MKVVNHILDEARMDLIPGGNQMNIRRFLVIHFTAGWTAKSSISYWRNTGAANAHLIIDRNGDIYQCKPFNRSAWHAGVSKWRDPNTGILYSGLNSCSIGIEAANLGAITPGTKYHSSLASQGFSGEIPYIMARHKNGGHYVAWEVFPDQLLDSLFKSAKVIVERYNLDDVIGHDDIAPSRRNDPGPAFPMGYLREYCGFPRNYISKI